MIDNELKGLLLESLPLFLDEFFSLEEKFIAVSFGVADTGFLPATSAISLESIKHDAITTGLDENYLKYSFDNPSYLYFGADRLFDAVQDYMDKIDIDDLNDEQYLKLSKLRFRGWHR